MVGWLAAADVGWSLEPGGCSFINQVGAVNENTGTLNDGIVLIYLYKYIFNARLPRDVVGFDARRPQCAL